MPTTSVLKRHANLVDRMATALGVDLEEKILEEATLMETYAMAGGVAVALQTQIVVEGATVAAPWCLGARQVEVFGSIEP